MSKLHLKITTHILFFFSIILSAQTQPEFSKLESKTDKLVTKFQEKNNIPGISVSVSYNDKLIYSKGFGFSDIEKQKKVDPAKTKFRIASISKTITAISLARLQEMGKVDLNKSIYKYLDSLPKKEYDITIEQLLSHRSGLIRDYRSNIDCGKNTFHKENFNETFEKTEFLYPPGSSSSYSNYGYQLLGILIEKLYGKPITQAKKDLVLDRAGLSGIVPDNYNEYDENTSKFYYRDKDEFKAYPCADCSFNFGPGCYLSTSEDLVKLGNSYMFADRIVSKQTFQNMIKARNFEKNYGLGFMTGKDYYGNYYFGHDGAYYGSRSFLRIYPKQRFVISILFNLNDKSFKYDELLSEIIFQYIDHIKNVE